MQPPDFKRYAPQEVQSATSVLMRVAGALQDLTDAYRLVGGLATTLVCREHGQFGPHIGSSDVDVMLSPDLIPKDPPLANRFQDAGLVPDGGDRQSMYWFAELNKYNRVRVDFLAPGFTKKPTEKVTIGGLQVWCAPGTAAVFTGPPRVLAKNDSKVAIAPASALIMSKARSFRDRAFGIGRPVDGAKAGKHAYDLLYLMTAYEAGIDSLIREWKEMDHPELKRETLDTLSDEFAGKSSSGPSLGGGFLRANLGPTRGLEEVVRDQVRAFVDSVR